MKRHQQSLPSAIEICLGEKLTRERALKLARDKRFGRELSAQALHDLRVFPYVDALDCTEPLDASKFTIYASGYLSPFVTDGLCACEGCRLRRTNAFAQGPCLYADATVVSDHFSGGLLQLPLHEWDGDDFWIWIQTLTRLEPLMRSSAVRFSRWAYTRCAAHGDAARVAQRAAAEKMADELLSGGKFSFSWGKNENGRSTFDYEHDLMRSAAEPQMFRGTLTRSFERFLNRTAREVAQGRASTDDTRKEFHDEFMSFLRPRLVRRFRENADGAVFSLAMAYMTNATVATSSPLDARILAHLDSLDPRLESLDRWKLPAPSSLPWFDGLSAKGVVEVRAEAHRALPAFRAFLRSSLFDPIPNAHLESDLRAQALEVESELRQLRQAKRRSSALSLTGLLLAVCAVGTRDVAAILAGLGGFVGTLATAEGLSTKAEQQEHALLHKPAHVLLTVKSKRKERPAHSKRESSS